MKNNVKMIQIPLLLGAVLYGGFYSFCAYAIGVIILALLFVKLGKDKKSRVVKNEIFYGTIALCISAIISAFAAIDKGQAWLGVLRVLVIAIWIFYLMQFTKEERDEALVIIPWTGVAMVLVGIISFILKGIMPEFTALFWQADRFGGTFQYSNTCALFLIIAMLILAKNENIHVKEQILFALLLLGIFLTGSKGGIVLLIPAFIWTLKTNKAFRKSGICMLAILLVGGMIYAVASGDFQNIGRIYTIFTNYSTLFGRLLYMKDALPLLIKNPLGIGYMGYWAIQSSVQTGVYTSMFIHNDWMQIGLDYGWIFLIAFLTMIIIQIVKGKQGITNKVILILVCVYSLMEFNLQYFCIVMMIFLLLDYSEKNIIVSKKIVAQENQIFTIIGLLVSGYFAVQSLLSYTGFNEKALLMYPYDTVAKEAILKQEDNKEKAISQATEILEINPYSSYSYNALAYAALMDGMYEEAIDYKLKVVEIEKYNMTEYSDFMDMIGIIETTSDSEYICSLCDQGKERINKLLKETKENTSDLAYKLRDKPVFIQLETSK